MDIQEVVSGPDSCPVGRPLETPTLENTTQTTETEVYNNQLQILALQAWPLSGIVSSRQVFQREWLSESLSVTKDPRLASTNPDGGRTSAGARTTKWTLPRPLVPE